MSTKLKPITFAITAILASTPTMAEELQPIIVSADLRESTEQDIAASVDVKTQADLQDQGATHFDDVLLKTPNVNYSGQSSRARHIQIRGIGERDEYTGAPNSSVGFSVDDMDFSGIGMAANLFDVKQVEVLRGPQNTRYGQSAIAGLIHIESNDPTPYKESMAETSVGQDNLKEIGFMTSGPVSSKEDATQYRFSLFKHTSDGFRDNNTLNKTDTNGRDELTLRGKLRFFPNSDTTVDLSVLHADLNNGYDMWARQNQKTKDSNYKTYSDDPGQDDQLSNGASVKAEWRSNPNFTVTSITSLANSNMKYSFDVDWIDYDPNMSDGTYNNLQHRRTFTQDLRLTSTENSKILNHSTDWLIGAYFSNLEEENKRSELFATCYGFTCSPPDEFNANTKSKFTNKKLAIYTQLEQAMNSKATLTYSLRVETNQKDFSQVKKLYGTYNSAGGDFYYDSDNPNETLWGGSVNYSYRYNETHTAYTGVTRGYKTGGFNTALTSGQKQTFDSETLYNYEVGLKSNYKQYGLKTNTTLFYMDRHNPQFDGYSTDPLNPNIYVFYTENLDHASNFGLETEFNWQATKKFNLYGSLGLLQTEVRGTPFNSSFTVTGRDQAHAPNYQANIGFKYRSTKGIYIQSDVTAVDGFYFDNVHNEKSDSYALIDARIGYETNSYEVYLWGKNLTDEKYSTRGFYFDQYDGDGEQRYINLGNPRQLGVTARVYF